MVVWSFSFRLDSSFNLVPNLSRSHVVEIFPQKFWLSPKADRLYKAAWSGEKHGDWHYWETLTVRGEKLCTHDPGTQEGLPHMFGDTFETFEISVPSSLQRGEVEDGFGEKLLGCAHFVTKVPRTPSPGHMELTQRSWSCLSQIWEILKNHFSLQQYWMPCPLLLVALQTDLSSKQCTLDP